MAHSFRLVTVVALTALVLPGCSSREIAGTGDTGTNDLERKTSAEVLQEAVAALRAATSVRISIASEGGQVQTEARVSRSATAGWYTDHGARAEYVKIAQTLYMKGSASVLTGIGLPAEVAELGAVTWLTVGRAQREALRGFTVDEHADLLNESSRALKPGLALLERVRTTAPGQRTTS